MAGAFVQLVTETVSVVLTLRSIDNRAGDRAVDELEALKVAVRAALAGWAPPDAFDVFALSAERVVSFVPGFFAYAIEFTTSDQLRITE
jgi:Flp pilus assembly protein TadB